MYGSGEQRATNWIADLRGFLGVRAAAAERCEFCGAPIGSQHIHLIEPSSRRLFCACEACGIENAAGESGRYRMVRRGVTRLRDFQMTNRHWDAFLIPIDMAFFCRSSVRDGILALYPGPAGAVESTLDLAAWDALAQCNPVLATLQEDTEALLVNRVSGLEVYYRVSIDRCYELVGAIRKQWHGISGGQGAREAIATFFDALNAEAQADARY